MATSVGTSNEVVRQEPHFANFTLPGTAMVQGGRQTARTARPVILVAYIRNLGAFGKDTDSLPLRLEGVSNNESTNTSDMFVVHVTKVI